MNLISKVIISLIFLVYLLLGLSHSKQQGFWHDEIYTLTFLKGVSVYNFEGSIWSGQDTLSDVYDYKTLLAEDHFFSNFSTQISHEGHPPMYFILLKGWSYLFGSTEVALRSFSLCCGLITFLVLFNLFRKKSKRSYSPWVILAMLIFNPFLFYFFTEGRMYALALLLASLSFRYWLIYQEDKKIKSKAFIYFCLSSISLLYTHYYGLFFLASLAFFELFTFGVKRTILNHTIALLFFLLWVPVLKSQLNFHTVHWTDGAISFGESILGYFQGIMQLLISPMENPLIYEQLIIVIILLSTIFLLLMNERKFAILLLGTIFMYGIQIYIFDQLIDHHSILVPRYYLFLLILLYWGLFKMVDTSLRLLSLSICVIYTVISSTVILHLYKLDRAPKQMFREVAGFVDGQLDSNNRVLVFEPKGPIVIGVAYYLQNNFRLMAVDSTTEDSVNSAVYIDEMLGVTYNENKYNHKQQEALEMIPFVGVFLYK